MNIKTQKVMPESFRAVTDKDATFQVVKFDLNGLYAKVIDGILTFEVANDFTGFFQLTDESARSMESCGLSSQDVDMALEKAMAQLQRLALVKFLADRVIVED